MISRFIAALMLAWMLGFAWFAMALPGPADDRVTDAIVVLTGGPGRVQRGLALLEQGKAKRLLVSGADRRVRPRELAAAHGAPEKLIDCCVDLGSDAVDTRSNADETAEWVARHHYRSIRLVTTDWHMLRARFELSRALGDEVTILADAVPSEPSLRALFEEYHKYLLRRLTAPLGI
ncbi:DUF218 domain-containing protein [Sphingomonas laterariae]|uniref:DUF218 domain-containing protein n=1 Tax=Edaphosphingomonas laterariae TaxID=861865 RepID=A0A239CDJ3_9SPHN|nr:YdcF family protein [Sphingomonas laterariae]SNS18316.1 DUF218 domain-containing protein [Sphingomonas laterariae]